MFDPLAAPKLKLQASEATVAIVDSRPATRTLAVPAITDVGQRGDAPLPIDLDMAERLLARLQPHVGEGWAAVRFEVEVVEATAGWRARGWTEEEHARVVLRVRAQDAATGRVVASCSGRSAGRSWSVDTNESRINGMFLGAFLNAFERCVGTDAFISAVNVGLRAQPAEL